MNDRSSNPQPGDLRSDDGASARIDAYFDRELDAQSCADLFAHLTRRPQSLSLVVRQQAILDALRAPAPTPDLKASILRDLGVKPAAQRYGYRQLSIWTRRISLAAAAALAVCGGLWMRSSAYRLPAAPPAHAGPVSDVVRTLNENVTPVSSVWDDVMNTARDIADRADQDRRMPIVNSPIPALTFPTPQWLRTFDPLHEAPSAHDVPTDVNTSGLGPMAFV